MLHCNIVKILWCSAQKNKCFCYQSPPTFVTSAQAGAHHPRFKFQQQGMDSRLRGNDEWDEMEDL